MSFEKETSFLTIFEKIPDPRVEGPNKKHLLIDVITIAISAVICRCESWYEVAEFAEHKKDWFEIFLKLPNGIPSHDTFRRVFMILDPKEFNNCFSEWTRLISKKFKKETIAIDGKTICGSSNTSLSLKAIHMVSAWATENGLVLSQIAVDKKSNEITATPELLNTLDIKNKIVTIDAMGAQTDIAEQVVNKKGDYVLALKKNHLSLYQRVTAAFEKGLETDFKDTDYDYFKENSEGHGRSEERNYFLLKDVSFLTRAKKEWKNLSSIGMVESLVTRNGKSTMEKRFYITSLKDTAEVFGNSVRKHWCVENNLHWTLDVQFREDYDKKAVKNSAQNFSVVKRMALNLLKKVPGKSTMKSKRLKASCNDKFLENVLTMSTN